MATSALTEELAVIGDQAEAPEVASASQWQLMRWRFQQHRLAVVSLFVLGAFYVLALFCEFLAPHDPGRYDVKFVLAPPRQLHFRDQDGWSLRPFVYGYTSARNTRTLALEYEVDRTQKHPIRFLVAGDTYKMWGLWEMQVHLFGIEDAATPLLLLGADHLGRDLMSRVVYGARVSLSIGLIGVVLSFVLGIFLGGLSGYFGGIIDLVIQRAIEVLRSIPGIPLWLTFTAVLPPGWSLIQRYFAITLILSILGWVDIARVVRGKFLALREEEFVLAALLAGTRQVPIIFQHLIPSFLSDLIARITLMVPGMILGETALSFLGLGLTDPVISWGVLLQAAQQISVVALSPWLLMPGALIVVVVLAFNFVGDGLRDAADPYAH